MRIAVAVCTYRRPEGLARLLKGLNRIDFDEALSVVVVENDERLAGGHRVCADIADGFRWPLRCVIEVKAGISHARNRSITECLQYAPDAIAMLDDDEWPDRQWLRELLRIQQLSNAHAVGGPVLPYFARAGTSCACYRSYYGLDQGLPDGAPCTLYGAGNVLVRTSCFDGLMPEPFEPVLALSGGEDLVFFQRLARRGFRMHWAANAVVHEFVPSERMTMRWLRNRQRRRGCLNVVAQRLIEPGAVSESVRAAKTAGTFLHAGIAALGGMASPHLRDRARLLFSYAEGRLLGHCGQLVEEYRRA